MSLFDRSLPEYEQLDITSNIVCIFSLSHEGIILTANRTFANCLKRSEASLTGVNVEILKPRVLSEESPQSFLFYIARESKWSGALQMIAGPDHSCFINVSVMQRGVGVVNGVFAAELELLEVICVGRDISEIMFADQEKTKYLEALQKLAFKTSHDIRSPLTTMQGLLDLVNKRHVKSDEIPKVLEYLDQSLAKLDDATRDMGAFISSNFSDLNTRISQ